MYVRADLPTSTGCPFPLVPPLSYPNATVSNATLDCTMTYAAQLGGTYIALCVVTVVLGASVAIVSALRFVVFVTRVRARVGPDALLVHLWKDSFSRLTLSINATFFVFGVSLAVYGGDLSGKRALVAKLQPTALLVRTDAAL